ncbi:MAG: glycosyltransferase [Candidatus Micrarchaeota archaeon]|nr:glycosyltransferase [Candidatus Micrarchaeota archaeon]
MGGAYSDTTVIIPTFNERRNIGRLIRRLLKLYPGIRVIISDDGSNDGTREEVMAMTSRSNGVRFLDRRNSRQHGLTVSVLDAVMSVKNSKIIVMDGDMQHPPEKVGELSKALDSCDIAVGVRTSVENWGFHRRVISKCMAYLSYAIFAVQGRKVCNDIMSGFFGIKADVFKRLIRENRGSFVPDGYKVLLDILRLCDSNNRLEEVYYSTFHRREYGQSKFRFKHVVNTLRSTFR